MDGKVVIITDASSPIGEALAIQIDKEGGNLVLNGNNKPLKLSKPAMVVTINPTSKKEVDGLVEQVMEKYGKIDVLIHNNNEVIPVSIENCTDAQYDRAMGMNVDSAFLFAQAVGKKMKEACCGRIIFVSSIHDEKPTGCAFTYSVSKGCVKMLTRELAIDLGLYHVTANVVEVGAMAGDETVFASDISFIYENLAYKVPGRTLATVDDVTNVVQFLASDNSRFINGSDIRLDGGFVLSYLPPRLNYEEYEAYKEAQK